MSYSQRATSMPFIKWNNFFIEHHTRGSTRVPRIIFYLSYMTKGVRYIFRYINSLLCFTELSNMTIAIIYTKYSVRRVKRWKD